MRYLTSSTFAFVLLVGIIIVSACVSSSKSEKVVPFGRLQVDSNKIVDEDGKPVQLYGMSLFWSQWMGQYYNPKSVAWLKDNWKCTIIRAAMGIEHGGYLENPQIEKKKITTVIDAAINNGLYVIVDWHDHHAENHTKEAKDFFASIAQTYGEHPNIIYELYNEPLQVSWTNVLKPYHQSVIDTIRHYDPDNLIVCGTPNWSQWVDSAAVDPLTDENVAYVIHFYAGTHRQELRDRAKAALDKGLALMVTEYGTTEATGDGPVDEEETRRWWAFMDQYSLSGCNWSIADKAEGSAALTPGAAAEGGWGDDMITPSGLFVRSKIREKKVN
jgi:endoglucanase